MGRVARSVASIRRAKPYSILLLGKGSPPPFEPWRERQTDTGPRGGAHQDRRAERRAPLTRRAAEDATRCRSRRAVPTGSLVQSERCGRIGLLGRRWFPNPSGRPPVGDGLEPAFPHGICGFRITCCDQVIQTAQLSEKIIAEVEAGEVARKVPDPITEVDLPSAHVARSPPLEDRAHIGGTVAYSCSGQATMARRNSTCEWNRSTVARRIRSQCGPATHSPSRSCASHCRRTAAPRSCTGARGAGDLGAISTPSSFRRSCSRYLAAAE